jgi:hypothetical protein
MTRAPLRRHRRLARLDQVDVLPRREVKPTGDVVECAVCEYILPRADLPKCGWHQVAGQWVCWFCKR